MYLHLKFISKPHGEKKPVVWTMRKKKPPVVWTEGFLISKRIKLLEQTNPLQARILRN